MDSLNFESHSAQVGKQIALEHLKLQIENVPITS